MSFFLWTIYLGVLGLSLVAYVKEEWRKYTVLGFIDFLISIVTWIGLFSFVTGQTIFTQDVWRIVFVLGLCWDVAGSLFFPHKLTSREMEDGPFFLRFASLLFIFPLYYGIYQLAFV